MTTTRQFPRPAGAQQLALLSPADSAGTTPAGPAGRGRTRPDTGDRRSAQLTLVPARGLPPQLRLDHRTRTIGRAGIAELRRILAESGSAASTAA